MWQTDSGVPTPPFTVSATLNVCGKPLCIDVDTSASTSVLAKKRPQECHIVPVTASQVLYEAIPVS